MWKSTERVNSRLRHREPRKQGIGREADSLLFYRSRSRYHKYGRPLRKASLDGQAADHQGGLCRTENHTGKAPSV